MAGLKLHVSLDQAEEGEVPAHADVFAGVELGAFLADDDVSGKDILAAVLLDAAEFKEFFIKLDAAVFAAVRFIRRRNCPAVIMLRGCFVL